MSYLFPIAQLVSSNNGTFYGSPGPVRSDRPPAAASRPPSADPYTRPQSTVSRGTVVVRAANAAGVVWLFADGQTLNDRYNCSSCRPPSAGRRCMHWLYTLGVMDTERPQCGRRQVGRSANPESARSPSGRSYEGGARHRFSIGSICLSTAFVLHRLRYSAVRRFMRVEVERRIQRLTVGRRNPEPLQLRGVCRRRSSPRISYVVQSGFRNPRVRREHATIH